jgi:hypothetical protein
VRLPPFAEHPAWGPALPSRAVVPRAPEPRRGKGPESGRQGREGGKVRVPRSNAGTSPRVVLSLGGGDDGRALAVGSTAVQYRGVDRARDPGKLRRGRGGDRASTTGNGCVGGPVPCAVHEPAAAMRWLGKPGPAYPGFPAQRASAPLGGGLGLGPFPDNGKKASPEGEYRNLRGVEPRRKGEGQKDPRGRGLPAGIPEAEPAAPGLKGG